MQESEELIVRLKRKSTRNAAFAELVSKNQQRLYWHIRKIVMNHDDTDDVLQNVFVKAWKNIESFREESSLFTWLFRIATNESISFINQKKRRATMPFNEIGDYLQDNLQGDSYFDGTAAQKKLQEAILKLPEKQRIVFNMKYFDAVKYEDMALILETSVGALKASYHHAVKKIEAMLEQEE